MKKIEKYLKKYGIMGCTIKVFKVISFKINNIFNNLDQKYMSKRKKKFKKIYKKQYNYIESLMQNKKYKYIFVFFPYTEWNLPIFQRPQQIALELSKRDDVLYLFCSLNNYNDEILGLYKKINNNLYVITDFDFVFNVNTNKRILHLYSTDTISKYEIVDEALAKKDKVLYEYIDEIHEEITHSMPKEYLMKHKLLLENEECYVSTTADKLFNDAKKVRTKRLTLSTNGVNLKDFVKNKNDTIPNEIKEIKKKYKKIICYYGALASWFDYELIKKVSKEFPEYAIVLIGIEYDKSFKESKIMELTNIFYLGKKNYYELHKYSENVDLLTIPFLINEITESTSPVKLFEYMATNIPILTTDMKECRKYKSVIIGKNHDDFIKKINSTISKKDNQEYLMLEKKEAEQNTWDKKAEALLELLKK